ncbi:DUF4190 domain-containing protein [Bacillus sp. EAC]|uniref:DUF4190 domain-containing protein n=1 Tax=Bacillus sp. EAC TaxID=1978338 RepID=UPI000B43CDB8|nr:DUF4190 domain-containing protein [Bacillus sp. EAC]
MGATNRKSISSLTLGVLSIIIPYIGFILGILGISLSKRSIVEIEISNEKGKGLAISGRICSIVGLCIQVFLILLLILGLVTYYTLINSH